MDLNRIEYLGLRRVMDRGTAEIIEQNEDVLFIMDTVSEVNMLACENDELAREVIDRYADRGFELITTPNRAAAEHAHKKFGYSNILECYKYAYLGELPELDKRLTLRTAVADDLDAITAVYDLLSSEEVSKTIDRGSVVMAYDEKGDWVGFMGEHLEGSLGMLYILPEHRRKGYAEALENAAFRWTMERGLIPYGQVVSDNMPSLELQKKMGLTVAEKPVYWTW